MKDPVHVLAAANRNYIMPLTVMLVSVAANFDPQRELVLHIVSNDATEKDKEDLRQSIAMNRPNLDRTEIHWYTFDASILEGLPVFSYFSPEVYAGLIGLMLLPENLERVVVLDCDVVVLKDISELYDLPVGPKMIYAAQDVATPFVSSRMGIFDYAERGLSPKTKLFNSGVVVYDLKRYRKENVTPRILEYMAVNAKKVKQQDQAGLNALLVGDWTELDHRWNQGFDVLFYEFWEIAGYSREEWARVRDNPYILHFSGEKKPWQKGRRGPRYSYFYKYLKKSVFKDSLPGHPYLESVIGFHAYYHLWSLARKIHKR
jgi:lipopolysaccharide biosynthesis glycosyltransferase